MTKTLQQIKDEYAIDHHCLESFDQLIRVDEITDRDVDQIAIRYAQEKNKELMEMLEYALDNIECDSKKNIAVALNIQQLIKKHKGGKS